MQLCGCFLRVMGYVSRDSVPISYEFKKKIYYDREIDFELRTIFRLLSHGLENIVF